MKADLIVFHPFLFALVPTLAYYTPGSGILLPEDMVLSAVVVLVITTILFAVLSVLLKSTQKSGIIVSTAILVCFGYGSLIILSTFIASVHPSLIFLCQANDATLMVAYFCLALIPIWILYKLRHFPTQLTIMFNWMSLGLVVANLAIIFLVSGHPDVQAHNVLLKNDQQSQDLDPYLRMPFKTKPDIYWIVMDGCANSETLSDVYKHDDHEFSSFLKQNGFFIPPQARSNYQLTYLSLASCLNGNYVNYLTQQLGKNATTAQGLFQLVRNNRLFRVLKQHGYTIVNVGSGVGFTEYPNVDINHQGGWGTCFNVELVQSTVFSGLKPVNKLINDASREKRLGLFSQIDKIEAIPGPKVVLAHVLLPHPPFTFNADGSPRYLKRINADGWSDAEYLEQIKFTHVQLQKLVKTLLRENDHRPVIIIQGDHGPAKDAHHDLPTPDYLKRRFHILNAYYFPGQKPELDANITPVNSLRVLLSYLEQRPVPMLTDRCYFSTYESMYDFKDVTGDLAVSQLEASQTSDEH